jgi:acyl-CoA thioesterase FadM
MLDELVFDTHVGEITHTGFRLFQRARKETTVIALIEAGFATFNYEKRKIVPVPETFLKAVNARNSGATVARPG